MLNYRIQVTKIKDGDPVEWDVFDRIVALWALSWVLKSAKEVALAYAKTK